MSRAAARLSCMLLVLAAAACGSRLDDRPDPRDGGAGAPLGDVWLPPLAADGRDPAAGDVDARVSHDLVEVDGGARDAGGPRDTGRPPDADPRRDADEHRDVGERRDAAGGGPDASVCPGACPLETGPCDDLDRDGVPLCVDCDDGNPDRYPGAPERCGDHRDGDCDGVVDEGCACATEWCADPRLNVSATGGDVLEQPGVLPGERALHVVHVPESRAWVELHLGCTREPVVLFLVAGWDTDWRVVREPTATLERVLWCNEFPSSAFTVEGAGDVPVERWCPSAGQDWLLYDTGTAAWARPQLEAYTGARVASWTSGAALSQVAIGYTCPTPCDVEASCAGRVCGEGGCGVSCGPACPVGRRCLPAGRCGGAVPDCIDGDGDGFGVGPDCLAADCDDRAPAVHPGAPEVPCDGIDGDCDPRTPDAPDADGDGHDRCGGGDAADPDALPADCDDARSETHPGRAELPCNGRDDDCDPATPDFVDADFDGVPLCPGVEVAPGGLRPDCDDRDFFHFPGGPEAVNDGLDSDCDGEDLTPEDGIGVFVAPTGSDNAPGTRTAPKRTLYRALQLAGTRPVFLAGGEYEAPIILTTSLYGGFEREGWTRDPAQRTVLRLSDDSPSLVVYFAPREVAGVTGEGSGRPGAGVLQDLTVLAPEGPCASSAGLLLGRQSMRTSFVRLVRVRVDGGGCDRNVGVRSYSYLWVEDSRISAGRGTRGAGVELQAGYLWLWNTVVDGGTGIGTDATNLGNVWYAEVDHSVLIAGPYGRAVGWGQHVAVVNSVLVGGTDSTLLWQDSDLRAAGNVLWAPDGVLFRGRSGDTAVVCGGLDPCPALEGNRVAEPGFVDAAAGDYHLRSDSPCIDAGTDPGELVSWPPRDIDGEERPRGLGWDAGLDEVR